MSIANNSAHDFGHNLVNPWSDLPKQHPVTHKDSLSDAMVWQETSYYKVNFTFYYFLLVYIVPHGSFYINTHIYTYIELQVHRMAVGNQPYAWDLPWGTQVNIGSVFFCLLFGYRL